jgi:hypothetical protein
MTCLNSDFEEKFREAFGREMRPEEREFFGIRDDGGSTTESQERQVAGRAKIECVTPFGE